MKANFLEYLPGESTRENMTNITIKLFTLILPLNLGAYYSAPENLVNLTTAVNLGLALVLFPTVGTYIEWHYIENFSTKKCKKI